MPGACLQLYCLVMFYHELIVPLADIKPFVKFVAIKCIIFLSFWQSVLISVLSELGAIEPTMDYTEEDISKGMLPTLLCCINTTLLHKHYSSA